MTRSSAAVLMPPARSVGGPRKYRFSLLMVLSMVVLAAGLVYGHRWRKASMAKAALVDGLASYDRADWDNARKMLGRYLSIDPDNVEVLTKYAQAQLSM